MEIKTKHQSFLYALVANDIKNTLTANLHLDLNNSTPLVAFQSFSPESGSFLFALPSNELKLTMSNIEFKFSLCHYLGLKIYNAHSECNVCQSSTNDPMGTHALRCLGHGNISKRHDHQNGYCCNQ